MISALDDDRELRNVDFSNYATSCRYKHQPMSAK